MEKYGNQTIWRQLNTEGWRWNEFMKIENESEMVLKINKGLLTENKVVAADFCFSVPKWYSRSLFFVPNAFSIFFTVKLTDYMKCLYPLILCKAWKMGGVMIRR